MRKTGSELISEMVGPAGSTSDGAFSGWARVELFYRAAASAG
jgi:hypothetical protein